MLNFAGPAEDCCIVLEFGLNIPRASRFARLPGFTDDAKLMHKYVSLSRAFQANKSWVVQLYCTLMSCCECN